MIRFYFSVRHSSDNIHKYTLPSDAKIRPSRDQCEGKVKLFFFSVVFILKSLFLVTKHILGTGDECHIYFAHQIIDNFAFYGVFMPDGVFVLYFAIILSVCIVTSLSGSQSNKQTKNMKFSARYDNFRGT